MPDQLQIVTFLVVLLFAGGMSVWAWALTRLSRRLPVLSYEPRRPVPWTGLDVLLVVLAWLALQTLAVRQIARLEGIDLHAENLDSTVLLVPSIVGSAFGGALAIGGMILWLKLGRGASLAELGLAGSATKDLSIGVAGFAAASILIYPLMLLLTQWVAYEHPIMQAVASDPGIDVLVVSTLSAVVIAPLVEELIFRVLFQGWLEKQRRFWRETQKTIPLLSRHTGPILVSAAVFGAAHYGNGPAPIPLFILGLFLGYLYQRTHRLLPCVALHVCVNALTTLQLWLSHFYPAPAAP